MRMRDGVPVEKRLKASYKRVRSGPMVARLIRLINLPAESEVI